MFSHNDKFSYSYQPSAGMNDLAICTHFLYKKISLVLRMSYVKGRRSFRLPPVSWTLQNGMLPVQIEVGIHGNSSLSEIKSSPGMLIEPQYSGGW